MAAKLAIMTFTMTQKDGTSMLPQMDKMAALLYLLKMGVTKNARLVTTGSAGSQLLQNIFPVQ